MEILIVGLGKMGLNLVLNLLENGYSVKGFDNDENSFIQLNENGGIPFESLQDLLNSSMIF